MVTGFRENILIRENVYKKEELLFNIILLFNQSIFIVFYQVFFNPKEIQ